MVHDQCFKPSEDQETLTSNLSGITETRCHFPEAASRKASANWLNGIGGETKDSQE